MTQWKNALSEGQLQQALELLIEAIKHHQRMPV